LSTDARGLKQTSPTRHFLKWGVVSEFDEPRGLGVVREEDGRSYRFHCTAISDGSRSIEVGAPVSFVVRPGHLGLLEAREVTSVRIDRTLPD
jgi:cold shock CspA family protein